jgi:cytochrome c oxidase subunit 2
VVVVALMLSFIVLYRRRKGPPPAPGPTHNTPLEIVWTGIPLAVVTVLFVMGLRAFLEIDRPVLLQLHSADVLHALYIPAFRVQRNAVPGRTTEMWFKPVRLGTYHAFCTQYCGNGHSRMTTEVVLGYQDVMPPYAAQFSGTAYKDKKLTAIVEYIKSLGNQDRTPP